jgi:predicted nucleic acid-binding protein
MILVDVNLLVYAWDRRAPLHETAVRWLDRELSESALRSEHYCRYIRSA